MKPVITTFDPADYLDSEDMIGQYLTQVMMEGDTDEMIEAIGHVAKARGMAAIARESGLGRESIYKALRPGSKPRFETVIKVLRALNIELRAQASDRQREEIAVSATSTTSPDLRADVPGRIRARGASSQSRSGR